MRVTVRDLKEKENNEMRFFHSALMFLNELFSLLLISGEIPAGLKKRMEESALTSLRLIFTLHVSNRFRKNLFNKIDQLDVYSFQSNRKSVGDFLYLIKRLEAKGNKYSFYSQDHKLLFDNLLEHICHYHQIRSNNVIFIENNKIAPPWIAEGSGTGSSRRGISE